MAELDSFAAEVISRSASGYGAAAASLLLERSPETAERFGDEAFSSWRTHLSQRARELATALSVSLPELFVYEVDWSRAAFAARGVQLSDLRASLDSLRQVLEEELPENVQELPGRYFEAAAVALQSEAAEGHTDAVARSENLPALRYVRALLGGRRREAIGLVLGAVEDGMTIEEAHSELLMPAQRIIGDLWHAHEVSIAQEHFVTATTEELMAVLLGTREQRAPREDRVVVAPAPGNVHRLGARAMSDWLDLEGWKVIYLGGELPASELAAAAESFRVDLVALSVALTTQLRSARETIRQIREVAPKAKVLLGGRLMDRHPELGERIGGDAVASTPAETVATAARLVES